MQRTETTTRVIEFSNNECLARVTFVSEDTTTEVTLFNGDGDTVLRWYFTSLEDAEEFARLFVKQ